MNTLPTPSLVHLEEGNIILEWIRDYCRIDFNIAAEGKFEVVVAAS